MAASDERFAAARGGDPEAFAEWMGSVELPIRLGLRPYARAIDVETVLQETFLRMWVLARDPERKLEGDNASLKFALGVARNLARAEARRYRREHLLPPEHLPEVPVDPEPTSDSNLRRAIQDCLNRLVGKPLEAMRIRLLFGDKFSDVALAEMIAMTRNTFLQNIVRARRQVAACMERQGIRLDEILS